MLCYSITFSSVLKVIHRWENPIIYHPDQETFDIPHNQNEISLCKIIDLLKHLKDHRGRWDAISLRFFMECGNKNSTANKEHLGGMYVSTSASQALTIGLHAWSYQ